MAVKNLTFIDYSDPKADAEYLNSVRSEVNNFITSSNQTINVSDTLQTSKAASIYSTKGDFYQEGAGSAANAYILESTDFIKPIFEYRHGMKIRFKATNTNTSSSTININSLGVKDIELNSSALNGNEIVSGNIISLEYDGNIDKFKIVTGVVEKYETKTLSSDVVSDGVISDLTTILTPGRTYMICGQFEFDVNVSTGDPSVSLYIMDGANVVLNLSHGDLNTNRVNFIKSFNTIYTMSGSSLTFDISSISPDSLVRGNGTRSSSFIQILELPYILSGTVN